ncbi:MAG TPA: NUDIX domain-containing protein [Bacteroidia bacterium]|jgi:8-oxo-dGTP pyrophosphatase MutT (NUDIX family)
MIKITSSDKIIRLVSINEHFKPLGNFIHVAVSHPEEVANVYASLLNNHKIKEVYLSNPDEKLLLEGFKSGFRVVEAAGGLVRNKNGEYLFIYRNGRWDLPKGKIEKNEPVETAAVREVEEECGVGGLTIMKELEPTYHTYFLEGTSILKPTYWFEMNCSDGAVLTPQAEEGITDVKWIAVKDLQMVRENTYPTILDIISHL